MLNYFQVDINNNNGFRELRRVLIVEGNEGLNEDCAISCAKCKEYKEDSDKYRKIMASLNSNLLK
tara:strand:- start:305 stop:499 length:195 start_codon:yes stop_codon:yes gene_type:complete